MSSTNSGAPTIRVSSGAQRTKTPPAVVSVLIVGIPSHFKESGSSFQVGRSRAAKAFGYGSGDEHLAVIKMIALNVADLVGYWTRVVVWEFEDGYEISLCKSVEAKKIEETYVGLKNPSKRVLEFSAHLASRRKVIGKSLNQHVNYDQVTEKKYLKSIEEFSAILTIVEQKSYTSFRRGKVSAAAGYALSAGIVLLF